MRSALPLLVLAACAALSPLDAHAKRPIDAPPRPAAFVEYDAQRDSWYQSIGEQLATDTDADVALFGEALRKDGENESDPLPPAPAGKAGYLLRYLTCKETDRCPEALAQWVDSDPDNAFVLAIAAESDDDALARKAVAALAQATRYDDYSADLQRIERHVVANYDTRPPQKPDGYYPAGCVDVTLGGIGPTLWVMQMFAYEKADIAAFDGLDADAKLRIARAMVDARHSPTAVLRGVELGAAVAVDPVDRAAYCGLEARAEAAEESIGWLLLEGDVKHPTVRRDFLDALRTRDAVDALDLVASRLPPEHRPDPVDEEAVAACVSGTPDDVDD